MLHKLNLIQYSDLISIANAHNCGRVYPLSVAEGIQEGDVFSKSVADLETILFWTQSGFAYLSGTVDESFLEEIYELMLDRSKTNPQYQQQGLGMIVAKRMIYYAIEQSKQPVWACHYKNTASEKMAEKLGFVKVSECSVIKRNG